MGCSQFWLDQIATTQARIVALQEAALNIETGAIESYTLDTGQTRQTVTKANIAMLERVLGSLLNRLATLEARCNIGGAGTTIVRPSF